MSKDDWFKISIVPVYVIGATVLFQYGYNDYFGIPYNYIGVSSVDFTLFVYSIMQIVLSVVGALKWLQWVEIVVLVGGVAFICLHWFWRKVVYILVAIFFIWLLIKMVLFGAYIAKHQTDYLVLSANCSQMSAEQKYIIPVTTNTQVILIPIDKNNKMTGSFVVKDPSQLQCSFEHKNIGVVLK